MHLCILGIRHWLNKLIPFGMMFGHVMVERGYNCLVKPFHLTIGLGMIGEVVFRCLTCKYPQTAAKNLETN